MDACHGRGGTGQFVGARCWYAEGEHRIERDNINLRPKEAGVVACCGPFQVFLTCQGVLGVAGELVFDGAQCRRDGPEGRYLHGQHVHGGGSGVCTGFAEGAGWFGQGGAEHAVHLGDAERGRIVPANTPQVRADGCSCGDRPGRPIFFGRRQHVLLYRVRDGQ